MLLAGDDSWMVQGGNMVGGVVVIYVCMAVNMCGMRGTYALLISDTGLASCRCGAGRSDVGNRCYGMAASGMAEHLACRGCWIVVSILVV